MSMFVCVAVLMTVSFLFKIKKKFMLFILQKKENSSSHVHQPTAAVVSLYSVLFLFYSYLFSTFFICFLFQNYTRVHSDCQNERSVRSFNKTTTYSFCLLFYRENK